MDFLLIAAGLVALYFGAEWLLRGAVSLSGKLNIPTLVVSLVIVGFGTSLPELLVSLSAAFSGASDISIGNVVGSNIANIMLIIGVSAIIYPISNWNSSVKRDALVMLASSFVVLGLVQFSYIGRIAGIIMLLMLAAYLGYTYVKESGKPDLDTPEEAKGEMLSWPFTSALIALGLVILFGGAELLIRGATSLAREFGIPEAVIGLTVVAVGTSLPELATAISASLKRHSDIMIGNVVGSNIFNLLCILGITALVLPIPVASRFSTFDVPVMVGVTAVFAGMLFFGRKIGRGAGVIMLALYAGYTLALL